MFFISGKIIHLPGLMPITFFFWLFRGWIGSIGIISLSLLISTIVKNFATPILIAFGGSILSLGMLSGSGKYFWPYALMMLGMNANASTNSMQGDYVLFFGMSILYFIVFTGCSIKYLKNA
ncbi:MAG: hypothetical protein PUD20_09120 [bacterium]|nr:hypothetical protein [bacterium]